MIRCIYLISFFIAILLQPSCMSPGKDSPIDPRESIDYASRLDSLGITLISIQPPVANYVHLVQTGNLLFLAGKGPGLGDGTMVKGKIGQDLSQEEGYEAARHVAINQISVLQDYLGDLNRVKRVVKVLGMVNCVDGFENQPEVINGFSDTMVAVFGERGRHARSAVGMNALPRNIAVEIEAIVEIY
ncbi:MAG TPA: RidA family protein [Saprospiraceae bacterium]|nr:RidA family protein [Saprospiraceae bacterium]